MVTLSELKQLIDSGVLSLSRFGRVLNLDRRTLHERIKRNSPELDRIEVQAILSELQRLEKEIKKKLN